MEKLYFLKVGNYYYRNSFWKWTKNWRKAEVLPHYRWAYYIKNDSSFAFYQILSLEEAVDGVCRDYRMLTHGDVIRAGDEIQYIDGSWATAILYIGRSVGESKIFRRKITLDN
jgi:hypothetical protein